MNLFISLGARNMNQIYYVDINPFNLIYFYKTKRFVTQSWIPKKSAIPTNLKKLDFYKIWIPNRCTFYTCFKKIVTNYHKVNLSKKINCNYKLI